MHPADRLLRLFSYDIWANDQILLTLQDHLDFPGAEQAISYYGHIAGTQEVWYDRIQDLSNEDLEVWPDYGLSVALQKLKTYTEKWRLLIEENRSDLDRNISYMNSKGQFETPLSDILHHLIIHGQHHRAQIASLLRKAGIAPPGTDFIFFCRSN
ncbi:Uncharacterized damage-inducible protein DinB (forms a four-helix bundle) [Fodinibius roseus]|uniref:Uncharacterized damage-inducible protein DinB (Forms a four-helix bundle) n=1 Tax=Fodinibius roseus TaxID=1194090 RepID=A0A1M5ABR1_9BACT|nr:DinB family protein [Fodinibius roseus]SHF27703.1 Uncharacterized damage-inducible protein DinB (forms a four-helix bundle) [Fodinibius roseus]